MKKVLAVAVMMLVSMATFAQNEVGQFSVMPKAGLNIADMQNVDNSDVRIGAVAGAEFEYGLTDMIGLSAGAIYSAQGYKKKIGSTTTFKVDYINVPLMANVYVLPGFAVKTGIQLGFNINAETSYEGNSGGDRNYSSDAKTIDFSIPVGVSYQYQNLVFDMRYNYGLTKVWENFKDKNSVFQFTVGYKFAF